MSDFTDIQTLLNDQGVFWPAQFIFDAMNEAQWELWVRTKATWTSAPLTLSTSTNLYTIPSSIIIPRFVEDSNLRYYPSSARQLEAFHRTWMENGPGQPMYFLVWDAFHFRTYPTPDQNYTSYTLWGVGYPTEITSDSQSIVGDPSYVNCLKSFTLAILFNATRPDLSDYNRQIGEGQLLSYKKHLRNYQSHNIRSLKFGKRHDLNQSGNIYELPVYYPVEC